MLRRAWSGLFLSFLLVSSFIFIGYCESSLAQECCSTNIDNLQILNDFDDNPGLEQELLELVNQHRSEKDLQPLILDVALMRIAREHSQGMATQGFISHSFPSGNLRERMGRAGYLYETARENVASAPTVMQAQAAFIESPGHENNMLATDISKVGIGIARCRSPYGHQLFITEIFANPREEYQTEMVEKAVASRMDELRLNGAGLMLLDPNLEQIASRSLSSINVPYKREELQSLLSTTANELPDADKTKLARVQANVQLVHNPKNLSIPSHAAEGQAQSYGAAVRQVTDNQNQSAFLVLTLIGIAR